MFNIGVVRLNVADGPRPYEKDNADPKEFNKKLAQKQENTPRARLITEKGDPGPTRG
jgi:hypothetical protein